jgi:hypothetical protein
MAISFSTYLYFLGAFLGVFGLGMVVGKFLLGIKQILDVGI